jgi:threonyl-tRNA synthetase
MRLLLWHCATLGSRDVRRSNRPPGIDSISGNPTTERFNDVLAAFVCVEGEDSAATADKGAEEIVALSRQLACERVAIVPFAHLTSSLMTDSKLARTLIEQVADAVEASGLTTKLTSFGFHKEFELHFVAKGHPGAVAFRQIT